MKAWLAAYRPQPVVAPAPAPEAAADPLQLIGRIETLLGELKTSLAA